MGFAERSAVEPGNFESLVRVAQLLRPILNQLVLVGGCATELLLTDSTTSPPRPTSDLDAIIEAGPASAFAVAQQLRNLGFNEVSANSPSISCWQIDHMVFALLPADASTPGHSTHWRKPAAASSKSFLLQPGLRVRFARAAFFCATKLELLTDAAANSFSQQDFQDLISVVNGRPELLGEIRQAEPELRRFIAAGIRQLINCTSAVDVIPHCLPSDSASQARVPLLLSRLRQITRV